MLQVARLAPKQLGEARDLVAGFFRAHLNPDGGFQDRSGASDLYYTVFGLDGLVALQEPLPLEQSTRYLRTFGDGADLDFVHLACLARAWAALRREPDAAIAARMLAHVETFRSADGGYDTTPGAPAGSAYGAFMALRAYQDLGRELPDPETVLASLQRLRGSDGSYAIYPGLLRPDAVTAAAVVASRHLGGAADRDAGMWLLDRCHASGGFFVAREAPMPDLLSTGTALHALYPPCVPIAGIREACLDFVDSLWTNRGGFYGNWGDDEARLRVPTTRCWRWGISASNRRERRGRRQHRSRDRASRPRARRAAHGERSLGGVVSRAAPCRPARRSSRCASPSSMAMRAAVGGPRLYRQRRRVADRSQNEDGGWERHHPQPHQHQRDGGRSWPRYPRSPLARHDWRRRSRARLTGCRGAAGATHA